VTIADAGGIARLKDAVRAAVDARHDELVDLADRIHAQPEVAWEEVRAAAWVADALTRNGFDVEHGAFGLPTALVGRSGTGSRRIGLMAEYDALPGLGHACGHNLIAATAVGAGAALAQIADDLDLTVEVYGCPAEEGGGGKIEMLEAGAFTGLELAMMAHPGPVDVARARPLAVAHQHVAYEGRSAHAGAYPDLGVNAADAMVVAQVAIGLLRQQLRDGTRVHGIVTNGGQAPNAIPATVEGRWYVRAENLAELAELTRRVNLCFEAGALASGTRLTITPESKPYSELRTDERALAAYIANAAALGRTCSTDGRAARMATASTDLGNVSQVVPAIHPYVGLDSGGAANHEPGFTAACRGSSAERLVREAATALGWSAVDIFGRT
jgi:amidohydrolase